MRRSLSFKKHFFMRNDILLVQEEPRGPSQLIEIPVTVNGIQKVKLPDVQQLRSTDNQIVVIKAIRLVTPKVSPRCATLAFPNAPLAELQKMFLVIYCEGWEKAQLIPLLVLNDVVDADSTAATTIPYRNKATRFNDWRKVDWAQSFLQFGNGSVSANTSYGVMLEVEYVKLNNQNLEIIGPS